MGPMRFVSVLYIVCCAGLLWSMEAKGADSGDFFNTMPDVPLMQGLVEIPEQAVVFDKPDGRIIESYAALDGRTSAQVMAYYEAVLPQFGWRRVRKGHFERPAEGLVLEFQEIEGQDILRVMLYPRP